MTPFNSARRLRRPRAMAAAIEAYFRAVRQLARSDYVPARIKPWWVP